MTAQTNMPSPISAPFLYLTARISPDNSSRLAFSSLTP